MAVAHALPPDVVPPALLLWSSSTMRIGLNGSQDLLALVVRRKWWVIVPFVALTCAFAVLTYVLPRTYVSETLILVRPRDVPQDFVKDLIAGSPEERLKANEQ